MSVARMFVWKYKYVCLPECLSGRMSACLQRVYMSEYLQRVCLHIFQRVCISVCVYVCRRFIISTCECVSACLSDCVLHQWLNICECVCVLLTLCLWMHVCMSCCILVYMSVCPECDWYVISCGILCVSSCGILCVSSWWFTLTSDAGAGLGDPG